MHSVLLHLIHDYGYWGILLILLLEMVGIPFPAETTLMASGVALGSHQFSAFPLLISAIAGNLIGSSIAYWIGRIFGRTIILRFGKYVRLTPERFSRVEKMFNKNKIYILLIGKFIAGVRVLIPYLAGINGLSFASFTFYNTISAILWVCAFVFCGSVMEKTWMHYRGFIGSHVVLIIVLGIGLVGGIISIKIWYRKLKSSSDPV